MSQNNNCESRCWFFTDCPRYSTDFQECLALGKLIKAEEERDELRAGLERLRKQIRDKDE